MPATLINNFIRQFTELEHGYLWFDQSLRGKLDELAEEIAFAKPNPGIHSVAEHVSHILAWRYECLLRFEGRRTDLMNGPDDWKDNAQLRKIGWTQLKKSLYESTKSMINLIKDKDDSYLDTHFQNEDYTYKYLLEGIIHHDIYHLCQIGVTLRLCNSK